MQKTMGRLAIVLTLAGPLAFPVASPGAAARPPQAPPGLASLWNRLSADRMIADIVRLSGPAMAGRQTGTAHDLRSAAYVRAHLTPSRDAPMPDDRVFRVGLQQSTPISTSRIRERSIVELTIGPSTRTLAVGRDYLPILDAPPVDRLAPLVFVGYGIVDPARGFDEYEGLDVRDRIVVFLRGQPPSYPTRVSHSQKAQEARARGAIAYLTATGPLRSPYEVRRGLPAGPLAYYGRTEADGDGGLPGAWISTDTAERLLESTGQSLASLQAEIHEGPTARSRALPVLARLSWEAERTAGRFYNVIATLDPAHETPRAETVVIGAHRDHFGRQAGLLFPGADDNASGTAVLLEVARVLRDAPQAPRRRLVFASFSGEEQGLLGSRWYVRHPLHSLRDTVLMINLDHVGAGNGRLTVGVAGHPRETAAQAALEAGLADRVDLYGYFPGGDHVPFHEAGIPTLAVVTGGPHPHFHQATDRAEAVDPDLLTAVARYVLALAWRTAYQP